MFEFFCPSSLSLLSRVVVQGCYCSSCSCCPGLLSRVAAAAAAAAVVVVAAAAAVVAAAARSFVLSFVRLVSERKEAKGNVGTGGAWSRGAGQFPSQLRFVASTETNEHGVGVCV